MHRLTPLLLAALLAACAGGPPDPQAIVDAAIATHGGDVLRHAVVEFDFRGKHFRITRDGGRFQYERLYTDSTGAVREVLNNDELYREVDGRRVDLTEKERLKMEEDVNSVVYFALLPFPLNDPAVQKRYLGATTIRGEPYHEVEITFRPEGGGRDYQDRFVYWFHRDRATMDYLAYFYYTNVTGSRFREAYNVRTVGGVRFADYHNYKADSVGVEDVEHYDTLFEEGRLTHVSDIVLENVRVTPLSD
ncbi:MAG: hypothetical protein KatS3mg042_0379 [Rhodothermaceae bacterium]|nr:MAG: hypothetical protein KatS3mg042_0379 [Rhodothermaceae bacterium]